MSGEQGIQLEIKHQLEKADIFGWPGVSLARLEAVMRRLGAELGEEEKHSLRRARTSVIIWQSLRITYIKLLVMLVISIALSTWAWAVTHQLAHFLWPLMVLIFLLLVSFTRMAIPSARPAYIKNTLAAVKYLDAKKHPRLSYTETANAIGQTSQTLFKALADRSAAYGYPPSVIDNLVKIAYVPMSALDDLAEVNPSADREDFIRESYQQYLLDILGLYLLGRADLIVAYRETVTALTNRVSEETDSGVPVELVSFIHPMTGMNRWQVYRDYIFPLASWLAFVVSLFSAIYGVAKG